jgi:type III secretion system YscQ/HrcQ family protein
MSALDYPMVPKIEAWNAIVALFGQPITLEGLQFQIEAAEAPPSDAPMQIMAVTKEGRFPVSITGFPVAQAAGIEFELSDLAALPETLRETIRSGLIAALNTALPDPIRSRIQSLDPVLAVPLAERWLKVTLDVGWGAPVELFVGGTLDAFAALGVASVTTPGHPAQIAQALAARIPLTARIALPGPTMGQRVLRDLAPGDLLLCPAEAAMQRRLITHCAEITLEAGPEEGWTVRTLTMTELDQHPAAGTEAPLQSLDDLPVRLSFVVAEKTLTLADLQAMQPGAVLGLDAPAPETGLEVTVLANGRVIGAGKLVELDGRAAVRLTAIARG